MKDLLELLRLVVSTVRYIDKQGRKGGACSIVVLILSVKILSEYIHFRLQLKGFTAIPSSISALFKNSRCVRE